jgi:hypothetical protein
MKNFQSIKDADYIKYIADQAGVPFLSIEHIFDESQDGKPKKSFTDRMIENVKTLRTLDLLHAIDTLSLNTGKSKEDLISILDIKKELLTTPQTEYIKQSMVFITEFNDKLSTLRKKINIYIVDNKLK